jgi:hypothetical protein
VKLTDTQLVLLSAASRRDDRALERFVRAPASLSGTVGNGIQARRMP